MQHNKQIKIRGECERFASLVSKSLLYILVILVPIRWLPAVSPDVVYYGFKLTAVLFIVLYAFTLILRGNYVLFTDVPLVYLFILIFGIISLIRFGHLTHFVYILFFLTMVAYSYFEDNINKLFVLFSLWVAILSVFSLIVTYGPIEGFDMVAPLSENYRSPVQRWPGEFIEINSFGFYGTRGIYALTSVAFVISTVYAIYGRSLAHTASSSILGLQLVSIIFLTGSGRAGLVMPVFLLIVLTLQRLNYSYVLPIIVFSPLVMWAFAYFLQSWQPARPVLILVNDFMSNRLALYLDSITIILTNTDAIIGWGLAPWETYELADIGVTNSLGSYGNTMTRPHNFFFEVAIQYGIVIGVLLLSFLFSISTKLSYIARNSRDPTSMAVAVIVLGMVFIGLLVGGKMGPFTLWDRQGFVWLLSLGYIIGRSGKGDL